jgi:hypothetical protein
MQMNVKQGVVAGLMLASVVGAQAQVQVVTGACTPSSVDFGALAAGTTQARLSCAPLLPLDGVGTLVQYQTVFDFRIDQPASFMAWVQGTVSRPTQQQPYWTGVGIAATLYYGDTYVIYGFGRGIGDAEGPAMLNPDFNPAFVDADGNQPVGSYRIVVSGNGFGPAPVGTITTQIGAVYGPEGPVSPVPEPATPGLQALALGLGALLWAARRRQAS